MKKYIIAYDILNPKRAYRVRKLLFAYAFGGQKSVLELLLSKRELKEIIALLNAILEENDKVNIIEVDNHIMLFGKAQILEYNKGVIIL